MDWDKFASHMLLDFYERDDRERSTQVPQWMDLRFLSRCVKEKLVSKIEACSLLQGAHMNKDKVVLCTKFAEVAASL